MANFLFLDESYHPETTIASLTGVLVPMQRYREIRERFYKIMPLFAKAEPNTINTQPRELHGRVLFQNEDSVDDAIRYDAFERIVDLVIDYQLRIYRVGYRKTKQVSTLLSADRNLIGLCWSGLLTILQPQYESELLIPVMDGWDTDTIQKLSSPLQMRDVILAQGYGEIFDLSNMDNIVGEVLYADSRYSIFIQIADMLSYLGNVRDLVGDGKTLGPYKKRLLRIAQRIPTNLLIEHIISLNITE